MPGDPGTDGQAGDPGEERDADEGGQEVGPPLNGVDLVEDPLQETVPTPVEHLAQDGDEGGQGSRDRSAESDDQALCADVPGEDPG